ncbi:MAG: hypothetical protein M3Y33_17670 [Actinomycetota bacterium]|nr:hypothetical protein [Actinomycetota bacterium]
MKNALKIALGLIALEIAFITMDHGTNQQKHLPALLLAAVYVAGIVLVAAARSRRKPAARQPNAHTGWQR